MSAPEDPAPLPLGAGDRPWGVLARRKVAEVGAKAILGCTAHSAEIDKGAALEGRNRNGFAPWRNAGKQLFATPVVWHTGQPSRRS